MAEVLASIRIDAPRRRSGGAGPTSVDLKRLFV
jgi:hypothetical protein